MSLNNFIPTIWAETLWQEKEKVLVAVKLCNRDYEGEIKQKGDRVTINGIGAVTVADYTKNTDINPPEVLDDNTRQLIIDQAKYFNFLIDDVDKAQQVPKVMKEAMHNAALALADVADQFIYGLTADDALTAAGITPGAISNEAVTAANITSVFAAMRTKLMKGNVPKGEKLYAEVSPDIEEKLVLAKVLRDTDNSKSLGAGYLGDFMGFEIYSSNNIPDEGGGTWRCIARTKRAITFAEQINDTEAYRPEKRFADAVKGLHLYGGKIIYPKELVVAKLKPAAETAV